MNCDGEIDVFRGKKFNFEYVHTQSTYYEPCAVIHHACVRQDNIDIIGGR